jgi:hypothetical protein
LSTIEDEYNDGLKDYFTKIESDLGARQRGIGIMLVIVRNGFDDKDSIEGLVDMASNIADKDVTKVLTNILKNIDDRRKGT